MANENNDLISWSSKLCCGVKVIDDQHKGLVDLINQMFKHVTGNGTQEHDYFNKVIQEVVSYVKVHFATEERIIQATKFPGYLEHKKEHENFIRVALENIQAFQAGKRYTLSNFVRFLRDWVLSHIALMDKQYFEYFKHIATRKADGKLSITSDDLKAQ